MRKTVFILLLGSIFFACSDDEKYSETAVVAFYPVNSIQYTNQDSIWLKMNVVSQGAMNQIAMRLVGDEIDTLLYKIDLGGALEYHEDSVLLFFDENWRDSLPLDLVFEVNEGFAYSRSLLYIQQAKSLSVLDTSIIYRSNSELLPNAFDLNAFLTYSFKDDESSAFVKEVSSSLADTINGVTTSDRVQFGITTSSFNNLTQKSIQSSFYASDLEDTVYSFVQDSRIICLHEVDQQQVFTMLLFSNIEDTLSMGEGRSYTIQVKQHIK